MVLKLGVAPWETSIGSECLRLRETKLQENGEGYILLSYMYSSPNIIRNLKLRQIKWAGHAAHMEKSRNSCRILVGKPEGKRHLLRPRNRWEDNNKMDLRELGCDAGDWIIELDQHTVKWWAYVMNLQVPWMPLN